MSTGGSLFYQCSLHFALFTKQDTMRPYTSNRRIRQRVICTPLFTVKLAHAVTSIRQSPVLKGYICLVLSYKVSYELNLF